MIIYNIIIQILLQIHISQEIKNRQQSMGGCISTKKQRGYQFNNKIPKKSSNQRHQDVVNKLYQDQNDRTAEQFVKQINLPFYNIIQSLQKQVSIRNICSQTNKAKMNSQHDYNLPIRYFHYPNHDTLQNLNKEQQKQINSNQIIVSDLQKIIIQLLIGEKPLKTKKYRQYQHILELQPQNMTHFRQLTHKINKPSHKMFCEILQNQIKCKLNPQQENKLLRNIFHSGKYDIISEIKHPIINGIFFSSKTQKMKNNQFLVKLPYFKIIPNCTISQDKQIYFLCYINPLLTSFCNQQQASQEFPQNIQTYYQFKNLIQSDINLFLSLFNMKRWTTLQLTPKNRIFSLFYQYLLILGIKMMIPVHNQHQKHNTISDFPIEVLKQILSYQFQTTKQLNKLSDVLQTIKLSIILFTGKEQENSSDYNYFFENMLKYISINTHTLIDAFYVQFRIQLNEKLHPIRNNPLNIQHNIHIKYKNYIYQEIQNNLIISLKGLTQKYIKIYTGNIKIFQVHTNDLNFQTLDKINSINQQWQKQTIAILNKIVSQDSQQKLDYQSIYKNLCTKAVSSQNMQICLEYLFHIKIVYFIVIFCTQSQLLSKSANCVDYSQQLKKQGSEFDQEGLSGSRIDISQEGSWLPINKITTKKQSGEVYNFITQIWYRIWQKFGDQKQLKNCSGQLCASFLTIQGIINGLHNIYSEQEQSCYYRALSVMFRLGRDPLSKYQAANSTKNMNWLLYLTNLFLGMKQRKQINLLQTNNTQPSHIKKKPKQDVNYFRNLYECIRIEKGYEPYQKVFYQMNANQLMSQILNNLPSNNFAGIFYRKQDLLFEDQLQTSGIEKVSYLYDSRQRIQELSNRSNYSENSLNRTRVRKNKKKFHQFMFNSHNQRANMIGVYQWGKGIISSPLLQPFTKMLDVLTISCGNFHTVIAATSGIYGWGENSSGQLGIQSKYAYGVKILIQQKINKKQDIQLSCGNQHTAALIDKRLYMWGPQQGGLTAGKGEKFDFISCGGLHNIALRKNVAYSWGRGQGGQLGQKIQVLKTKAKQETTQFYIDSPMPINKLPKIIKSACGDAHSVLLSQDGEVYVFGFSYQGQCGLGITGQSQQFQIFEPVKLQIFDKIIQDIYAGSTFTFFKTRQGQIYGCGLNDCHQLGMGKTMKVFQKKYISKSKNMKKNRLGQLQYSKPKKLDIFDAQQVKVKEIVCGENHCLATVRYMGDNIMTMGWGLNRNLQISFDFPAQSLAPRTIDKLSPFTFQQIHCGSNFSVGLAQNTMEYMTLQKLQKNIKNFLSQLIKFKFQ